MKYGAVRKFCPKTSCVTAYLNTQLKHGAVQSRALFLCSCSRCISSSGFRWAPFHIILNLLERFIFIWILHLAEIVGYVFKFWELELKSSAYHRNLIANAVSIKTKKIRVLFINLGTDTKLSLKTILSKACLGMWPNNWINLGLFATFTKC